MNIARRLALTVVIAALLSAVAFGTGWALRPSDEPSGEDRPTNAGSTIEPEEAPSTDAPRPPKEPIEPKDPGLTPGPALLEPDDEGAEVKDLQARLKQIDWFEADVTGFYGEVTTEAVRGFQAKREIPVTGEVDQRTLN
ncbi:MAG TPA: peptidoglycan-binding domain-containing protein, partial [Nocardioides sp.]|nr:peptidoglycan-binding domain-containing protein [Nocardioides sp.]